MSLGLRSRGAEVAPAYTQETDVGKALFGLLWVYAHQHLVILLLMATAGSLDNRVPLLTGGFPAKGADFSLAGHQGPSSNG